MTSHQEEARSRLADDSTLHVDRQVNHNGGALAVRNNNERKHAGDRNRRRNLFIVSALYTTLFAGAFLGWGPMKLMLESNGAFASTCDNAETGDGDDVCAEQSTSLLNIHIFATVLFVLSPLLGEISDRFGAPTLMNLLGLSGSLGLIVLAISTRLHIDSLLYPALLLLGVMFVSTSLMTVATGMMFAGRARTRVISALNALLDAGSVTYLTLWAVQNATGASVGAVLTGYAILAALCFGGAVYLWRVVVPDTDTDTESSRDEEEEKTNIGTSLKEACDTMTVGDHGVSASSSRKSSHGDNAASELDVTKHIGEMKSQTELEEGDAREGFENEPSQAIPPTSAPANDTGQKAGHISLQPYVLIANRRPMQQLRSGQFLLLAAFYAFHVAKNLFTLTTAKDFLASLGDADLGHQYLTIFTLLMPISTAGLPFVDQALHRYGFHTGFQAINALSVIHGIIQVSSDSLNVQVLGFVVFSFYRCFLFAVTFSFVPEFLGAKVIGKGAGFLNLGAGLCSFVNIPLVGLAIDSGDFFGPNLFYTLLVVPCIIFAFFIGKGARKEQRAPDSLRR